MKMKAESLNVLALPAWELRPSEKFDAVFIAGQIVSVGSCAAFNRADCI